jgi:MFS family permease
MRRTYFKLYASAFLLDCAIMIGFTVVPFFIMRQLGGGARMLGMISAAQGASYGLGSLISARFVGRAKNGLNWARAGILGYAFLFCPAHLIREPYLYGLISTLGAGCMAFVWPALWAWVGGEPDVKLRNRIIANYNVSWSVGLCVGPLFAGPLYKVAYGLPFLLIFFIAAAAFALVVRLPHEKAHFGGASTQVEQERAAHAEVSESHLHYAWFANMFGWLMAGACRSVYAKRVEQLAADDRLAVFGSGLFSGLTLTDAVLVFSALVFMINFSRMVLFYWMGRTHRWHHRFLPVIGFQLAAGAAVCWLGVTESFIWMALCFTAVGVCNGFGFLVAVSYSLADPALKHRRAAINEAMVGLGGFAGAMGFGLFAGWFSVTMPFLWFPVVVAAAIAVEWLLFRHGVRRNRRVGPVLRPFDA